MEGRQDCVQGLRIGTVGPLREQFVRQPALDEPAHLRDHADHALADREAELHDLREQARTARDRMAAEQTDLEAQLRVSQQALADFEERLRREEAARQERERALLAAQRASTARSYAGAYVATGLVCPIRGPVSFVDSWGAPRATTGSHQGVDLMNPRGTPNVAVVFEIKLLSVK